MLAMVGSYFMMSQIVAQDQLSATLSVQMILICLSILVAGVVISTFISRSITKPIAEFREAARKIGEGKMDTRIGIRTKDEFGKLAYSFNMMAAEIKTTHESLQRHTEELETKVKERTSELERKLSELTETKTAVVNMMDDMDNANKELVVTKGELEESLK
ncbi:MAG: HAMP domain-containing protein, partial [Candidatus Aenigmatarchaeota archaeon]